MIGIAVIGAGHWGPNLIRNFHDDPRSEVLWVIDRDPSRLQEVQTRFASMATSVDIADALGDPRVDAVVVATPTVTHYEIVRAALAAGKHVLVEKPITTNVAHAEELCSLAEKTRRVLMVGHVFLYNAGRPRGEAVPRGRRCSGTSTTSRSSGRTSVPSGCDVNAAWDLASHDISIVNYWFDSEPESASACGGAWLTPGIEDAVFATLRYPDGMLAHLHASWLHPRKARDVTVVGDRRMLTFDDMNHTEPLRVYDKQVTDGGDEPGFIDTFASFRASVRDGDITIPRVTAGEPLKYGVSTTSSSASPRAPSR